MLLFIDVVFVDFHLFKSNGFIVNGLKAMIFRGPVYVQSRGTTLQLVSCILTVPLKAEHKIYTCSLTALIRIYFLLGFYELCSVWRMLILFVEALWSSWVCVDNGVFEYVQVVVGSEEEEVTEEEEVVVEVEVLVEEEEEILSLVVVVEVLEEAEEPVEEEGVVVVVAEEVEWKEEARLLLSLIDMKVFSLLRVKKMLLLLRILFLVKLFIMRREFLCR